MFLLLFSDLFCFYVVIFLYDASVVDDNTKQEAQLLLGDRATRKHAKDS